MFFSIPDLGLKVDLMSYNAISIMELDSDEADTYLRSWICLSLNPAQIYRVKD